MYKYLLQSIDDINWLAIIPLLIFFVFFSVTIVSTIRKKKSFVEKMEKLPLQ
ncbi:MAG: hypothetical protein KTR24_00820 [Saprospiraceae bacterium]|nr:hypothetical protein [Saprospiraceae bacterium]